MPRNHIPAAERRTNVGAVIPIPMLDRLLALAMLRNCTISDLIREGLQLVLDAEKQQFVVKD